MATKDRRGPHVDSSPTPRGMCDQNFAFIFTGKYKGIVDDDGNSDQKPKKKYHKKKKNK